MSAWMGNAAFSCRQGAQEREIPAICLERDVFDWIGRHRYDHLMTSGVLNLTQACSGKGERAEASCLSILHARRGNM